jgi:hypothetical protein
MRFRVADVMQRTTIGWRVRRWQGACRRRRHQQRCQREWCRLCETRGRPVKTTGTGIFIEVLFFFPHCAKKEVVTMAAMTRLPTRVAARKTSVWLPIDFTFQIAIPYLSVCYRASAQKYIPQTTVIHGAVPSMSDSLSSMLDACPIWCPPTSPVAHLVPLGDTAATPGTHAIVHLTIPQTHFCMPVHWETYNADTVVTATCEWGLHILIILHLRVLPCLAQLRFCIQHIHIAC